MSQIDIQTLVDAHIARLQEDLEKISDPKVRRLAELRLAYPDCNKEQIARLYQHEINRTLPEEDIRKACMGDDFIPVDEHAKRFGYTALRQSNIEGPDTASEYTIDETHAEIAASPGSFDSEAADIDSFRSCHTSKDF